MKYFLILTLVLALNKNYFLWAQPTDQPGWWSLDLPQNPERPRSDFLAPFISMVLPSFDQFYEKQTTAGGVYLTYSLLGLSQMSVSMLEAPESSNNSSTDTSKVFSSKDERLRRGFLGAQMIQTAGALSAFHSFRSAVKTRKSLGEYTFLNNQEDSADLMKAPFRFDFLTRPTTWAVLGLELLAIALDLQKRTGPTHFTNSDAAYTLGFSYQAGVGEEALFRGWMMPYVANGGWSPWASNLFTSTSFALAHLSASNRIPWPQFILGYYLGQVALWNDWSIQESIFIHTWWDIFAIGASWATAEQNKEQAFYLPLIDLPISL